MFAVDKRRWWWPGHTLTFLIQLLKFLNVMPCSGITITWMLAQRMQLPFHPHTVKLNKLKSRKKIRIIVVSSHFAAHLLKSWPLLHFIIPLLIDHVIKTNNCKYLRSARLPKQTAGIHSLCQCFVDLIPDINFHFL